MNRRISGFALLLLCLFFAACVLFAWWPEGDESEEPPEMGTSVPVYSSDS